LYAVRWKILEDSMDAASGEKQGADRMSEYRFVTEWRLQESIERVWQALNTPGAYSQWWPNMKRFRDLTPGVTGVGSRSERVVRGRLPYDLCYVITVTRVERPREMAHDAAGDLVGEGRMVLEEKGTETVVTIYWNVRTTKGWMNWFTFLLRPLLSWNHTQVMAAGERGLTDWLKDPANAALPQGEVE
jgi:uncharacterized protein YndB with AHSA1/START domain